MSLITTTDTTFFDPFEQLLQKPTERIDTVATTIATESRQFDRHEEFTTSRLAQAINDALRHDPITVNLLQFSA